MSIYYPSYRVYTPDEIKFLRHSYTIAKARIKQRQKEHNDFALAARIVGLYNKGLIDPLKLAELAAALELMQRPGVVRK